MLHFDATEFGKRFRRRYYWATIKRNAWWVAVVIAAYWWAIESASMNNLIHQDQDHYQTNQEIHNQATKPDGGGGGKGF